MKQLNKFLEILLIGILSLFLINCQKEDLQSEISTTTENSPTQLKSALIPTDLLNLVGTINAMVDNGLLSNAEGKSLISKLNNAMRSRDKGNINALKGNLKSFVNEVNALLYSQRISWEVGNLIIKVAEFVMEFPNGNFTDPRDGQLYSVVLIGDQVWMSQDLRATKYNDGTDIPNITDNSDWINLTSGAYCWYENNESFKSLYGGLYNWHAVNTGKLCPIGWHVPSNKEWITLIGYLGGEDVAGGKLKEAGYSHWLYPNTGATNKSGFTSLPSGDRIGQFGEFYNLLGYGIYWSTDEVSTTHAINRVSVFDDSNFRIGYDKKTAGFSVRCIKD